MHKVGVVKLRFFDDLRSDWNGTGPRPLSSVLWYPAAPHCKCGRVDYGPLFYFDGAAWDVEPISDLRKLPLVLLSHGTGGSALSLGWLGQRLAELGYMVLSVNHHGNTIEETYLAEGFLCWWERARDLTVALNLVLETEPYGPMVDEEKVLAAGLSLGGFTALALGGGRTDMEVFKTWAESLENFGSGPREFPNLDVEYARLVKESTQFKKSLARHRQNYRDMRVKAVFAMAPALAGAFTEQSLAGYPVPVAILAGEADEEVPTGDNARRLVEKIPGAVLTVLPGPVGHYVFLNEATEMGKIQEPVICCDAPGVDRRAIHVQAAAMAHAHFSGVVGNSHHG